MPASGDEVVEDFVRFVRAIAQNPELRVFRNRHFAPQKYLLAVEQDAVHADLPDGRDPAAAG